ncbi:MAG: hypothetical protein RIR26_2841 [Pseudomonadota bacterium]|jgi:hypothetical protein
MRRFYANIGEMTLKLLNFLLITLIAGRAWAAADGRGNPEGPQKLALIQSTKVPPADRVVVMRGRGTVRDAENLNSGVLFYIEYEHQARSGRPVSTVIRQLDVNGKTLVLENTTYTPDGQFKKYLMEQFQTNEKAVVEVVQGKILMTWTADGESKTATAEAKNNSVASGALMAYMNGFISDLGAGRSLPVELVVPERSSVFNFDIAPRSANCETQKQDLCVSLTMSNFFLQKLVKPIQMSFQKAPDGWRPLSLQAPALVRKTSGKNFEKFTARIDYPRL